MREPVRARGFTLLEVLLVLVIAGVVSASVASVLRRQERFFATVALRVGERVSLRDAMGILPAELRALAPAAGDVEAFSDSALDVRVTIGAGIVCAAPGDGTLHVALSGDRTPPVLGAFAMTPQPGDIALVYDEGSLANPSDDAWRDASITGASTVATECEASPFAGDTGGDPHVRLMVDPVAAVAAVSRSGTFLRLLRRVRYRLYRGSTGDWYLGYAEWNGVAFGAVQPVSGPYASYSRRGASGLSFRYFDSLGTELASGDASSRIRRIDLIARSVGAPALSGNGRVVRDSQSIAVNPRNRE